ncbi:MAG: YncE family protein [Thermoplasmatales archaeon]
MKKKNIGKSRKAITFLILSILITSSFTSLYYAHREKSAANREFQDDVKTSSLVPFSGEPHINISSPTTITGVDGPNSMTTDPNNGYTYVADFTADGVSVLDGNSLLETYALESGLEANGIVYNAYYNNLYVSLFSSTSDGQVAVMSTTGTVIAYINVGSGSGPAGITALPDGYVYVSLSGSHFVDVIHDTSNVSDISVPFSPEWIEYDPINGYVYVISNGGPTATISIINPSDNMVIGSVSAPIGATVYDNGFIYDFGENSIMSVNGEDTTIPPSISSQSKQVSGYFYAASEGPGNFVFVANNETDSMDLFSVSGFSMQYLGSINDPGVSPQGVSYNPITQYLYLANLKSDSVEAYHVEILEKLTFSESGLPLDASWGVTIAGVTNTSTSGSVSFYLANGSYTYTVETPVMYNGETFTANPSGDALVNGPTDIILVYSEKEYSVTFLESGLPSGIQWSVTFNGNTQSTTGTSISFSSVSGDYSYTVNPPAGYSTSPESGILTVSSSLSISIDFTQNLTTLYSLNFLESGLPAGKNWSVDIIGVSNTTYNKSEISFSLQSGVYSYKFYSSGYSASPPDGEVNLNSEQTVTVLFTPDTTQTYAVTFSETGLPSGMKWNVNILNIGNYSSTSSTLTVNLPEGTYSYSVYSEGYDSTPSTGNFILPSSETISILFILIPIVQYNVTFHETGLYSRFPWYVDIEDTNYSSYSDNITVDLKQGAYNYTTYSFGFISNPKSGTFNIVNSNISVNVKFTYFSFTKREGMNVIYGGNSYNFSADVNYSYFEYRQNTLSQSELFQNYLENFLTNSNFYLRNVSVVQNPNDSQVKGELEQDIIYDLLVWSELNLQTLQLNFGPTSVFYQNLNNLSNGEWANTVGSTLPVVFNFATAAGQIATIVGDFEDSALTPSAVTSIMGAVNSIMSGVKVAETEYSQDTASSMLNTLENYNIVSGPQYNSTTFMANLSTLSATELSNMLGQLYNDTDPHSFSSGALAVVSNAFSNLLSYGFPYLTGSRDSISEIVQSALSSIKNTDEKAAIESSKDIFQEVATSLMDQSFLTMQSSSALQTGSLNDLVDQADSIDSFQIDPNLLLGIANALNSQFLIPQGELLSSLTGTQKSLSLFYSGLQPLIPELDQNVPNITMASSVAYLSTMIRESWLQWFATSYRLNEMDITPESTNNQWNLAMNLLSNQSYESAAYLKSLSVLAGNLASNGSAPIYNNIVSSFFKLRNENETLSEFNLMEKINPSLVAQFGNDVVEILDQSWNEVMKLVNKFVSRLANDGGVLVNGVEVFSSSVYSGISDLSTGVMNGFEYLGNGIEATWKWLNSLIIPDNSIPTLYSASAVLGSQWIIIRNESAYFEFSNGLLYSNNLWASAVVSSSGGLIATDLMPGQNVSISTGSTANISPFFFNSSFTMENQRSFEQEPGLVYNYNTSMYEGTLNFTEVRYAVTFELVNHLHGQKWELQIIEPDGNVEWEYNASGSSLNVTLGSGQYSFVFIPYYSGYAKEYGNFTVNGSSVIEMINEKPKPNSPFLYYFLIALIIASLSVILVLEVRKKGNRF